MIACKHLEEIRIIDDNFNFTDNEEITKIELRKTGCTNKQNYK